MSQSTLSPESHAGNNARPDASDMTDIAELPADTVTSANSAGSATGSAAAVRPLAAREPFEEFDYRPVPVMAPVTLFLGISSVIALFGLLGTCLALAGCICGVVCLRQISRARGDLGGWWLGVAGLTLSVVFFASGTTIQAYTYATEVPEGYQRVNFTSDIAKKGFVFQDGRTDFHPDVKQLEGQQIFLKGYMYPTRQSTDLTTFLLVKDNQQCCFGGQPEVTDMILVQLPARIAADYTASLVSVAGTFRIKPTEGPANLTPVYLLEGTHFTRARNSF